MMSTDDARLLSRFPFLAFCLENLPSVEFDLASSGVAFRDPIDLSINSGMLSMRPSQVESIVRKQVAAAYATTEDAVALTVGASGANTLLAAWLSAKGRHRKLLVESPGFENLREVPKIFGCTVETYHRPYEGESTSENILDVLRQSMSINIGAVCVTNPHNPTGRCLKADTLREAAGEFRECNSLLYVNESHLEFSPHRDSISVAGLAPNILVSSSLSKAFGFGQLRFGWLIGSPTIIREIRHLSLALMGMPPVPTLTYGLAAFRTRNKLREATASELSHRLEMLEVALARFCPQHRWVKPDAGIFGLLHLCGIRDDVSFVKDLLSVTRILVMPGSLFEAPGTVRLSFGAWNLNFGDTAERFARFAGTYCGRS